MTGPRVEILYFDGCPNHERARVLVEGILRELDVQAVVEPIEVRDAEAAKRMRFLGSPTVRVNGRDVEPGADRRDDFVLACRVYRSDRGVAGQPDPDWIRAALAEAAE